MNLEKVSNKTLENKREEYLSRIEYLEKSLATTTSTLFSLTLTASVNSLWKKIHKIDAELAYRETNGVVI